MTTKNVSEMVTWSSSSTAVATVDAKGLLQGKAAGQTTITATLGTVSAGLTQQYQATATLTDNTTKNVTAEVTWASSDDQVVQISNSNANGDAKGKATALKVGTVTIKATLGTVVGETSLEVTDAVVASIAVTPVAKTLANGLTLQYQAVATLTDTTTKDVTGEVTWASSDIQVAQVSNSDANGDDKGKATALKVGTVTITATLGMAVGSTTLEVIDAEVVDGNRRVASAH